MDKKIIIGIDQSYKDTGITIALNGKVKNVFDLKLAKLKNNSERRTELRCFLDKLITKMLTKSDDVTVIIERIRLSSQGFINIDYIKSIGALNATMVDVANSHGVPIYSVDTRSWKSNIIGTSKGRNNEYGFDEKKWPTILWAISNGYEGYIKEEVSKQKKKAVICKNGERYTYNDNKADSIGIALYGFLPYNKQKLEEEH